MEMPLDQESELRLGQGLQFESLPPLLGHGGVDPEILRPMLGVSAGDQSRDGGAVQAAKSEREGPLARGIHVLDVVECDENGTRLAQYAQRLEDGGLDYSSGVVVG
jgi:hypothetical protein